MTTIKPTIGRKVWYHQSNPILTPLVCFNPAYPMDATIVFVWDDRAVNLVVLDHAGGMHAVLNVVLKQPGDAEPDGGYCEWMPFQVGQAAPVVGTHIPPPVTMLPYIVPTWVPGLPAWPGGVTTCAAEATLSGSSGPAARW